MKTFARYRSALYATIIAALLCACLWSAGRLADARQRAGQALGELEACRAMGASIAALKDRPRGAGPLDQTDLHRRGQHALEQLGVPAEHLVQIAPEVPRNIGQSAFREVPSQVILRDLTLRQVVGFLLSMTGDRSTLQARSLRLYAPSERDDGTRWAVELTLSYLTYEPPPTTMNPAGATEREQSR